MGTKWLHSSQEKASSEKIMEAIFEKIVSGELAATDKKGLRLERDKMENELNPKQVAEQASKKPQESGEFAEQPKPAKSGKTGKPPQVDAPKVEPSQVERPKVEPPPTTSSGSTLAHFESAFDKFMGDGPPMFD